MQVVQDVCNVVQDDHIEWGRRAAHCSRSLSTCRRVELCGAVSLAFDAGLLFILPRHLQRPAQDVQQQEPALLAEHSPP
jgi:hypothetical protein